MMLFHRLLVFDAGQGCLLLVLGEPFPCQLLRFGYLFGSHQFGKFDRCFSAQRPFWSRWVHIAHAWQAISKRVFCP